MASTITRSKSKVSDTELCNYLDEKFSDFEKRFADNIKQMISQEFSSLLQNQEMRINELSQQVNNQNDVIESLKVEINLLKQEKSATKDQVDIIRDLKVEVEKLKNDNFHYAQVEKKALALEQYSRRQSVRLDGIKVSENESSEDLQKIVKDCFIEAEVVVPDTVLDSVHRIGPIYLDQSNNRCQSILIKFSNFSHRTEFYRARKNLSGSKRVRIDLTKSNYTLLKNARALLYESKIKDVYAFSDINCRLKIVNKETNDSSFFESMDDVRNFLSVS